VAEVDANNSLKAAIVRGHEILAQKDARDNSYYYLNNAHGDVVGLIDAAGSMVNRYQYDAFGNTVEAVEKVQNRFRYAGEQYDQITGQYYLRARFYNPILGRFTQEDTYRGDGLNLYSYVQNNPVKYTDPSGYMCEIKGNTYGENSENKTKIEAARYVFRGDERTPQEIIDSGGFTPKGNDADIWQHVEGNQQSNFISTTTDPELAKDFAGPTGYVYLIRIREGHPHVDVNEKFGYGNEFAHEKEIAVQGGIDISDVMGWQKVSPKMIFAAAFFEKNSKFLEYV